jgi:hypothetical protein
MHQVRHEPQNAPFRPMNFKSHTSIINDHSLFVNNFDYFFIKYFHLPGRMIGNMVISVFGEMFEKGAAGFGN